MKKLLIAVLLFPALAQAQAWPARPIRWAVPYTGGGITDVVTRMLTQKVQARLGQSIVVAEIAKRATVITTAGVKAEQ